VENVVEVSEDFGGEMRDRLRSGPRNSPRNLPRRFGSSIPRRIRLVFGSPAGAVRAAQF
jgi:hypothetical protein